MYYYNPLVSIFKLLNFKYHCKFVSSGKIVYIPDNMMEATEEGSSRNIFLNFIYICIYVICIYIYIYI